MTAKPSHLIFGGTTKAGSTSLFAWFAGHPDIRTSEFKEIRFFLDAAYPVDAALPYACGLKAYQDMFRGDGDVAMEACPDYLHDPVALERIARDLPDALVVFVLRDPIERLISWYDFSRQTGQAEDGSFDAYVSAQREGDAARPRAQHLMTLEQGRYADALEIALAQLSRERVLVLDFARLRTDPDGVCREICDRAGLDADYFDGFSFEAQNRSEAVKAPGLARAQRAVHRGIKRVLSGFPAIFRAIRSVAGPVNRALNRANRQSDAKRDWVEAHDFSELRAYYADSNARIASMTGISFGGNQSGSKR